MKEIVLSVRFKVIVCDVVIDKAGIAAIVFLNAVIEPELKIFLMLIKEGEAAVNVVEGVVGFFKESVPVFKGRLF